jgi:hypothetical protein
MRIALLGPLEVTDDAGIPAAVAGLRLRRLLARLAVDPGRLVTTQALIDAIWPGKSPGPAQPSQAPPRDSPQPRQQTSATTPLPPRGSARAEARSRSAATINAMNVSLVSVYAHKSSIHRRDRSDRDGSGPGRGRRVVSDVRSVRSGPRR